MTLLEETVAREPVRSVEVTIPGTAAGSDRRMRFVFQMGDEWLVAVWLLNPCKIELYAQRRPGS